MSEKHAIAQKKKWESIPFKERSTRMKILAKLRWAGKSNREKRTHAMLMVKARGKKNI